MAMAESSNFEYKHYSGKVKTAMTNLAQTVLEEVGGEIESQVKDNTRVAKEGGGKTKNSWTHTVDSYDLEHIVEVGSPEENAIWEEFGTGEHALNGDGRKGGWFYVDEQGKGHFTHGKTPTRALQKAYDSLKNKVIRRIQNVFKGGLS